jgi:hypothetical protein
MGKKENKIITTEYKQWLSQLKQNFRKLQIKAFILSSPQHVRRWVKFYLNSGTSCSTNEIIKRLEHNYICHNFKKVVVDG